MKRTLTLFAALVLLAVGAAAQKLSYQAVVRNSANELVYDATVSVSLQILAADGVTVQYAETQTATTNQNGLLTLIIGEHPTGTYSLASVNWTDASIKTEITLPTGDVVTNIMPVTAVPYALYADNTGGNLNQVQSDWAETNTASKAYIQNKPAIPTAVSQLTNDVNYITVNEVPTSISHYTNDANYITINDVPAQVNADWNATSGAAQILNKPAIPTAVSQLTNDVSYITVNEVPTSISHYTNDANYITINDVPAQVNADWAETNTASKAYIQNKPAIPAVPAWAMEVNKPVYNYTEIQGAPTSISYYTNDANYITLNDVPAQVNADWNATSGTAQILNKPTIPTVPTNVSAFNNDAGYLTAANVQEAANIPTNVSAFTNDAGYLTSYTETDPQFNAWDKDYNDLTNKPTIPTVPTNVSAFSNDANYITINDVPTAISHYTNDANYITINQVPTSISYYTNDANYITLNDVPAQVNADWNATSGTAQILNKPTIPTVPTNVSAFNNDAGYLTAANVQEAANIPTNVSAFTNDAGYLTSYTETDPQFNAWDKDYNDLTNKPAIPTVPTNVSAFTNDAGYLTGYTETQTLADVTANGNSAGNRQLKNVSDPTDAQDAVTKSYLAAQTDAITASIQQQFDNLASQYQQQLGALTNTFQHTLDSLGAVIGAQQATINAQQHQLDSLINSGSTPTPPTPAAPTATTGTATDVTENSATLTGSISNPDNVVITAQGFEWKVTTGGTYTVVNATGETMTYSLTGLTASTGYTYRAFVTTASGTVYGSEVTFTTAAASTPSVTSSSPCTASATHAAQTGSTYQGNGYNGANHGLETVVNGKINSVTDYDGNEYPVVQIGSQCWLAENMRCTHSPLTGTYIVTPSSSGYTYTGKQARWYTVTVDLNGNSVTMDSAACVAHKFGLLYNWNAAVDIYNTSYGELSINTSSNNAVNTTFTGNRQGICPTGWHVPTDDEWNAMELVVNGSDVSSSTGYRGTHAGKLAGGDDWNSSTTSGAPGDYTNTSRNSSGFSAVPAGYCLGSSFSNAGYDASFWSSSQRVGDTDNAWYRYLGYSDAGVDRDDYNKNNGFSVRCLRDESGNTAQTQPTATTGTASSITETSATLNGSVSNPDNVDITAQGFEWKATEGGTYATVNATGETMTYSLTGLTASTGYTYRAFVTTASGTVYGSEVTFTTAASTPSVTSSSPCTASATHAAQTGSAYQGNGYNGANHGLETVVNGKINSVTDYDGNEYPVVQIGSQCWLAENMRCTHSPLTGTYIVTPSSSGYTFTGKQARWYTGTAYLNGNSVTMDSAACVAHKFGLLYNWNAAVDIYNTSYGELSINTSSNNAVNTTFTGNRQGICPTGWHVPTDDEWNAMELVVNGSDVSSSTGYRGTHAGKLAGGDDWNSSTTSGAPGDYTNTSRNSSGFSAVPAGFCNGSSFYYAGNVANFWSSSQDEGDTSLAWYRGLHSSNAGVYRYYNGKYNGFSVRCLRN